MTVSSYAYRMPRSLLAIAALVAAVLGIISVGFAAVSLTIDRSRITPDEAALAFMFFGVLGVAYATASILCAIRAFGQTIPEWWSSARAVIAASALGFLAVAPIATFGDFADNVAAVSLVALIGGVVPVTVFLICEKLSASEDDSVDQAG
jgi:hypothetical protein